MIILVLVWRTLIYLWRRYARKHFLYFRSQWPWPLDLIFPPLVTLVQRYVSTKLEVSTSFLFLENWRQRMDWRTDGQRRGATLIAVRLHNKRVVRCDVSIAYIMCKCRIMAMFCVWCSAKACYSEESTQSAKHTSTNISATKAVSVTVCCAVLENYLFHTTVVAGVFVFLL